MAMSYFSNISEACVGLSALIHESGTTVDSRVGLTREVVNNSLTIMNPMDRYLSVKNRLNNPLAAIAETIWVLSGRKDIDTILPYLPRAKDFSDDGETWRAAYGPRLRKFGEEHEGGVPVDQLMETYNLLKKDPTSRRAVISIYDPVLDTGVTSKDIPCNNWLMFRVVEGKLNMSVVVRSNDLVWGFTGINSFEWSVVQQLMAEWLGVPVGTQTWFQGSLHMYERHFINFPNGEKPFEVVYGDWGVCQLPLGISPESLDEELSAFLDVIYRYEIGDFSISYDSALNSPLLTAWLGYFEAYWLVQNNDPANLRLTRAHEILDHFMSAAWTHGTTLEYQLRIYVNKVMKRLSLDAYQAPSSVLEEPPSTSEGFWVEIESLISEFSVGLATQERVGEEHPDPNLPGVVNDIFWRTSAASLTLAFTVDQGRYLEYSDSLSRWLDDLDTRENSPSTTKYETGRECLNALKELIPEGEQFFQDDPWDHKELIPALLDLYVFCSS